MSRLSTDDRAAIHDVIYRYCRGIDRRDWDLVRSCYHAGAHESHGAYQGDIAGFIAFSRQATESIQMTAHCITNIFLDPQPDGTVWSEAYATCYHRLCHTDGLRQDMTVGARYLDQFSVQDNEWRIADRTVVFDWSRVDPVLAEIPPEFVGAAPWGRQDADDFSYRCFKRRP